MPRSGCPYSVIRWLPWSTLLILVGCDSTTESTVRTASARRAEEVAAARLAQEGNAPKPASDVPVRPAGPSDTQPAPA
ncbi:MAG: hypothetical protein HY718_21500, partial [Planctomycetes bacterium]|nr:hypothetical protein [Planctomycetota bacterium]